MLIFAETPRGGVQKSCIVPVLRRRSVKAARAGPGMSAATHRAAARYAGVMLPLPVARKTDPIVER